MQLIKRAEHARLYLFNVVILAESNAILMELYILFHTLLYKYVLYLLGVCFIANALWSVCVAYLYQLSTFLFYRLPGSIICTDGRVASGYNYNNRLQTCTLKDRHSMYSHIYNSYTGWMWVDNKNVSADLRLGQQKVVLFLIMLCLRLTVGIYTYYVDIYPNSILFCTN